MTYKTEQEKFWAGEFGDKYIARNQSDELLASNLNFFSKAFSQVGKPSSLIEFGANIGMNLKAIKLLFPSIRLAGIEINGQAAEQLRTLVEKDSVYQCSILDYSNSERFEVALIKGVLIHINPEMIKSVYEKLFAASSKYILIGEYYNPSPVSVTYRGHSDRLFKRDFAGEMLDLYPELRLIDYGFCYKRDRSFPQDDITWFLLEKQ
jgi:pseudaminic acid biosynthesis-associated methylase